MAGAGEGVTPDLLSEEVVERRFPLGSSARDLNADRDALVGYLSASAARLDELQLQTEDHARELRSHGTCWRHSVPRRSSRART
jgi:hypothetical protein